MLGCNHTIQAQGEFFESRFGRAPGWVKQRIVFVSNGDDDHYWMGLENWSEVDAMITKLQTAATEAFGPKPETT
jgi:hypothetical protein